VEVVSFFSFFGALTLLEVIGFAKPMPKNLAPKVSPTKKGSQLASFIY
jgi:hypothetical protein